MKKTFLYPFLILVLAVSLCSYFILVQIRPSVMVSRVDQGMVRDSVTGNLKVYASSSFDLCLFLLKLLPETLEKCPLYSIFFYYFLMIISIFQFLQKITKNLLQNDENSRKPSKNRNLRRICTRKPVELYYSVTF